MLYGSFLVIYHPILRFQLFCFCVTQAVLDITTTEVADYVVGGVMACDSSRFDVIIEKNIPLILSVGALDMVNFGPKDTIPANFQQRKIYVHNPQVISHIPLVFSSCLLVL